MRTSKKILALILATLLLMTGIPAFATDAEEEAFSEEVVIEEAEQTEEAEQEITEEAEEVIVQGFLK